MKSLRFILALGVVLAAASGLALEKKKATVTIVNKSAWDLHQFFLSPADKDEWGPDQLGDEVIKTGESFQLKDIPCDSYDVRLVDEDGDDCVVTDVDLCGGHERWEITAGDLLKCEAR